MKTRIIKRHISAFYTNDAESTASLMNESEKIRIPDKILRRAADIAASALGNTKNDSHEQASACAAYVLRFAYLLARDGKLVEVESPKRQPKKPKAKQK